MVKLLTPTNIVMGIIFIPLLIFVLIKISASLSGGVKKIKPMKILLLPLAFLWKTFSNPWRLIGWALLLVPIFGFYFIITKKNSENLVAPAPKQSEEIPIEKEEWRIVFTSLDKLMKREGGKQEGFFDLKVLSLVETPDKKNLTISYISASGKIKTMALSRENAEEQFYSGWFENTHPNKRRDNIKIYLLEDPASAYESIDAVTGKKSKNFPAFSGHVGEGEMTVKIFKRISSG